MKRSRPWPRHWPDGDDSVADQLEAAAAASAAQRQAAEAQRRAAQRRLAAADLLMADHREADVELRDAQRQLAFVERRAAAVDSELAAAGRKAAWAELWAKESKDWLEAAGRRAMAAQVNSRLTEALQEVRLESRKVAEAQQRALRLGKLAAAERRAGMEQLAAAERQLAKVTAEFREQESDSLFIPPAVAEKLLLLVLPHSLLDPLLGDLEEHFLMIQERHGHRWAAICYWRQALGSAWPVIRLRVATFLSATAVFRHAQRFFSWWW